MSTFETNRPGFCRVLAVHNSPGSPYAASTPLTYDVAIDFGPPTGTRIYERIKPANGYPRRYDVYGATPGTTGLISWDGNVPSFTIDWSEDVTTDCTEGLV